MEASTSTNEISNHYDSVEKQTFKMEFTRDNEEEIKPLMLIRSINFQEVQPIDYTYSVTDQKGETYLTGSLDNCETGSIAKLLRDKAVREMLEQIYNALKEMSRGKVLNMRETNIVAETQWLLGVLEEMEQNCPQFLEVLFIVLESLLPKSLEQDAMEVQGLISNGEGENGAELMYRDDRENNRMEDVHVFSCTETNTIKRECMDTSDSENSAGNFALDQTSVEIKTEPDDRISVDMEETAIAEEGDISTMCFSPRTSDHKEKPEVIISKSKGKKKEKSLQRLHKSRQGIEKEKESRETDSSESGKVSNTNANSRAYADVCIFCNRYKKNFQELLAHVNSHAGRKVKCKICFKECNTSEDLRQHTQSHQNEREILLKAIDLSVQYKCITEHRKSVSNNNATKQMAARAASCRMLTVYSCAGCNLLFKTQADLYLHKKNSCSRNVGEKSSTSHPAEAQFLHICKTCGQAFTKKRSLTAHMSCHSKEKPYNCEACGKSFRSKTWFLRHKQTFMDRNQKTDQDKDRRLIKNSKKRSKRRHICKTCGKRFVEKDRLEAHISWHLKERPYSCEGCGKSFTEKSNMSRHKRARVCQKDL
uniref:Zinc finger protein 721-like isoform X3 n=1 Tax=Crassostrea virginica TaxID=6565 RepID=A0A8B8DJZ9_CRAVI|nr:zinc finger protein 721-like isoform X3 [Crassostrea virginica]